MDPSNVFTLFLDYLVEIGVFNTFKVSPRVMSIGSWGGVVSHT